VSRVLFLAESFHPVLGGGEIHVRRLGAALVAAGERATVVTRRSEADWPREDAVDGIRIVRVPPSGPPRIGKYLMVPAAVRAVRREARGHDVLVVRGTRVLGLPGLLAARACGLAVILQPETNGELSGEALSWGKGWAGGRRERVLRRLVALECTLLRDAEAAVAMSSAIRDEMIAAGLARERIELIPHGVDTARFRPATAEERLVERRALGLPAGGVLAVYTGRLLRGKGLSTLVEAFATAAAAVSDLRLALVGSGRGQSLSVDDELQSQVAAAGLADRVFLPGRVDGVEGWLRAADVFVFPSRFEALGISLVEAAACALPAVASRTGGIVDVVEDGFSGLLIPPGDAAALAESLVALARDPQRRAEMGRRAREVALSRFDEAHALARYRALFRSLTPRPASSSRPGRAPRAGAGPPPSPASPA
jgi:1,2-diacylglycerol 3-alpha-glucosyltransferase